MTWGGKKVCWTGKQDCWGEPGVMSGFFQQLGLFLIFTDKRRKNILLIDNITKITYNEGESAKN